MAKNKQQFSGYVRDDSLSVPQRVAHFLDWAATNKPGEFVAYNMIVQAIMGYKHMPRLDSEEVQRVKRASAANVRSTLATKYDREIISLPGVGVRATFSDADRLEHVAPKKAKRLDGARRSFMLTANAIDLRSVPDTAAYAPLKRWLGHEVRDVLKLIGSPEFERKLLPPSTQAPDESAK